MKANTHLSLVGLIVLLIIGTACKDGSTPTNSNNNNNNGPTPIPPEFACDNGLSDGTFDCQNINLVARISAADLSGDGVNDIWGWTDPDTQKEYALVGLSDGVSFVDLSDPAAPELLGKLSESSPKALGAAGSGKTVPHGVLDEDEKSSLWRDMKVYNNHLFVVSDGQVHGMQVFDLTRLRNVANPPESFSEDAFYDQFVAAHNIAINEESGYAYAVGSDTYGGGLHIIDISDPLNPVFAGFHADSSFGRNNTGYVHDTHCVNYTGPDPDHAGREICVNSGETHVVIADVTDKTATSTIGSVTYGGRGYVHQGWLTEDHRYFILGDEFDERQNQHGTRTYIFDVTDLDNPVLLNTYTAGTGSIDHNLYVKGDLLYQSNYTSGLRILDISDIASGTLTEVGFFDTYPSDDDAKFDGSWSNYPYFESGLIIVSDMSNGLFILQPNLQ
ncbi:MAG: choice-of-anchor B family protein [Balneolaceae bacterium]|nr:choice-of-anchor B family protein [Balneolaceae bacterium]